MTDAEILIPLKIDLQISASSQDEYLCHLVELARSNIQREGIVLDDNVSDGMLIEMYAAHLYRTRRTPAPMPRMLRWALNNRLLSQKGADSDG